MPLEVSVEDDTCIRVFGFESSEVLNDRSKQPALGALGFTGETATRLKRPHSPLNTSALGAD